MASGAKLGKIAGTALAGFAGLAGLAGAALYSRLRRPLPRTAGTLRLPGLNAPVRVLRDQWGVPHIYANTSADLFMAQGFVHAQDRLWQMELQRRTGHGRLAEIFGEIALDTDRFVRVMGFGRVAERELDTLADEARLVIEAYVRGVNACVDQSANRLPIEFTILRFRPEPWQPIDVLVWGKMLAQNLARSWVTEALRAQLVALVGAERASALEPAYLAGHPLTLPQGAHYHAAIGMDPLQTAEAAARFVGSGEVGQGSNAWVVGGGRAASGQPLLANDVHLILQVPSLWYENHLSGGEYHVTGASLPGTPGVVIGHNERVAWGVTNGENDVQDLFIERFDPADPTRYEFRGAWEQASIVREEIRVKGRAEPHVEEVRITRHGPIISSLIPTSDQRPATTDQDRDDGGTRRSPVVGRPSSDGQELALRWTALDPSQTLDAALELNRATDWASFRAAVMRWTSPTLNFVYADVEGHFGYMFGGHMPVRARGDGRLPAPGWTGEYEWTGLIPPAELPYALDPEDGLVVTANNRIIGDEYPYPMPSEYLPGYRATRIRQLLDQTLGHDARSFAGIQGDQRSLPGLELVALAGRLPAMGPIAQQARDTLAAWDGELTADSVGGAIYARLREKLLEAAYSEVASSLRQVGGLGAFAGLLGDTYVWRALPLLLKRLAARDDSWLPPGRTGDALLREAWAATIVELRDELGDDMREWRYGRFHTLTLRHPLGSVPALAPLFNRGPYPMGGDADTVRMGYAPRQYALQPFYVAPSYRQICDTSNWDRSQSMHPVGQSGQPSSPHYADFVQPYLNVQYHPMPWSRAHVEDATVDRLVLEP